MLGVRPTWGLLFVFRAGYCEGLKHFLLWGWLCDVRPGAHLSEVDFGFFGGFRNLVGGFALFLALGRNGLLTWCLLQCTTLLGGISSLRVSCSGIFFGWTHLFTSDQRE